MGKEFSNTDRNVFLIKLEKMIDRGALLSRYSRASNFDIRDVYAKEFTGDNKHGADFYRRIFIDYGDESISELVTAQIGVQGISNICAQNMEDSRIGLSFLEKSSRYVRYDKKLAGKYPYLSGSECGFSRDLADEYDQVCDQLFDLYTLSLDTLTEKLREKLPVEDILHDVKTVSEAVDEKTVEKAYKKAITARAMDDARFVLPASTKTNLGISGNGRAYINMLLRMKSSGVPEIKETGIKIEEELEPEFPELIEAARGRHAMDAINYRVLREEAIYKDLDFDRAEPVTLVSNSGEKEFESLLETLGKGKGSPKKNESLTEDLVDSLVNIRQNRRDKPGRLLEIPDACFLVNMSFGTFRDFHRHRMLTIIRRPVRNTHNKFVPELFQENSELLKKYNDLMNKSRIVWKSLADKYGVERSQYAVPFSQIYGFLVKGNLQEFMYFTELRTTPAAHYEIRNISSLMYKEIQRVYPRLSRVSKFVDQNQYGVGRIYEEIRKEIKRQNFQKSKP